MNRESKRIFIQRINNLPTLPTVLTKIIELAESKNANARDLGEVLSKDPSITSTILKLVNSAFYGNLRHISSINHASVILGFQMVKTIAMGVSIYQTEATGKGLDREQFWLHSIGTATFARKLAAAVGVPEGLDLDSVFLSGLLHDVGKVIFDNYYSEEYEKTVELARAEGLWIGEAEERVMGLTHQDAGFYLGRKWQFPNPVVAAIRYHHHIGKAAEKDQKLCGIVHAADHCCRKIALGSGGDDQQVPLDPQVEQFGITATVIAQVSKDVESDRVSLESFVAGN